MGSGERLNRPSGDIAKCETTTDEKPAKAGSLISKMPSLSCSLLWLFEVALKSPSTTGSENKNSIFGDQVPKWCIRDKANIPKHQRPIGIKGV